MTASRSAVIDKAARALCPYGWDDAYWRLGQSDRNQKHVQATARRSAEAAINAIAPGLLDGKSWVAPVEPSAAMLQASTMQAPTWDDEASARKWAAMRDAHLGVSP